LIADKQTAVKIDFRAIFGDLKRIWKGALPSHKPNNVRVLKRNEM
jgi:hypothetical protein